MRVSWLCGLLFCTACSSGIKIDVLGIESSGTRNGAVAIRFNRVIDPLTITPSSVSIPGASGTFQVRGADVLFLPRLPQLPDSSDAGLAPNRTYTVTLDSSIRGLIGGRFAGPQSLTFATGADFELQPAFEARAGASVEVMGTVPTAGENGFGTLTGIDDRHRLFVRFDPVVIEFDRPITPGATAVSVRRIEEPDTEFEIVVTVTQDRERSRMEIQIVEPGAYLEGTVRDGNYVVLLDGLRGLGDAQEASFELRFSTVTTDCELTERGPSFRDHDRDGQIDIGGLVTPNELAIHAVPFVGGLATAQSGVEPASPSTEETTANWAGVAFWTGREVRYDNATEIAAGLRLRGQGRNAATPIFLPLAGKATDGDLILIGDEACDLFTGDETTGQIVFHYRRVLIETTEAGRPRLTGHGLFPLVIMVEREAVITGDIDVTGVTSVGTQGGLGGPGGGRGGTKGDLGQAPANVRGRLTGLIEGGAGAGAIDPTDDFTDPDVLVCGGAGGDGNETLGGGGGGGLFCLACPADIVLDRDGYAARINAGGGGGAQAGGDGGICLVSGAILRRGAAVVDAGAAGRIYLADANGSGGIDVYGDGAREVGFGKTSIVTEFTDLVADTSSVNSVKVVSNAPEFPYSIDNPAGRAIRVFVDSIEGTAAGPDFTTGTLDTMEVALHFDGVTSKSRGEPQYVSRDFIAPGAAVKRFVRFRIVFDLMLIGGREMLLDSFAPPGHQLRDVAPNIDAEVAPGVPAVSSVKARISCGDRVPNR